jgi:hypothetical protein
MESSLKKKANVVGYAVGLTKRRTRKAEELSAIFYVARKVPLKKLKRKDRLPTTILVHGKRVATDVIVLRRLETLGDNSKNIKRDRPMNIGAEIEAMLFEKNEEASPGKGGGTAGAVVKDKMKTKFLLSCAHVLHAVNDDIIQPAKSHGQGNATKQDKNAKPQDFKDTVGSVRKLAGHGIDAGYAEAAATKDIIGIGPYGSVQEPMPGLPVMKSGATTGVTEGTIQHDDQKIFDKLANVLVNEHPEIFKDQPQSKLPSLEGLFLIKPESFGSGGDSGSLVVVGPENALSDWVDNHDVIKKLKKDARDALKKQLLHSAIGLLCFKGTGNNVGYPGVIGQKLQLALDALEVELDF